MFPVLCSQVIEHVAMVPSMIDELCRVLAPGGRLRSARLATIAGMGLMEKAWSRCTRRLR